MINDIVLIRRDHHAAIARDTKFGEKLIKSMHTYAYHSVAEPYARAVGAVNSADHTLICIAGDKLWYEANLVNRPYNENVAYDLVKAFAWRHGYKIVKRGRESQ